MTITKCAECPFMDVLVHHCLYNFECVLIILDEEIIHPLCPIAQGKPFTISFTPIEETKNN